MTKILRWTIGDQSGIGLSILEESIRTAKKNFSHLGLDYVVCSNSSSKELEGICLRNRVDILDSSWESFPLPHDVVPLVDDQGEKTSTPRGRQGSFWKLCPARICVDSHELVCDNDVVFQTCPSEIDDFFHGEKALISQDLVCSLGKYTRFVGTPYNSGIFGLPPKLDFAFELQKTWSSFGKMSPLYSRDEQGLISLCILGWRSGFITVPASKIRMLFDEGCPRLATYIDDIENGFPTQRVAEIFFSKGSLDGEVLHFIGANRRNVHRYWSLYKMKVL
jgi:hypothetical protein